MTRIVSTLLITLVSSLVAVGQPAARYLNTGSVTNAQVNAIEFVNEGQFVVNTFDLPWSSFNTRSFINRGVMTGSSGFSFGNFDFGGNESMADSILNSRLGVISASDGLGIGIIVNGTIGALYPQGSFVLLNASNITSRGEIRAGASGVIEVKGDTVDLAGSSVIIDPLGVSGFFGFRGVSVTSSNFIPDAGLYDLAWGIDSNTNVFLPSIIQNAGTNFFVVSPSFTITNNAGLFAWCRTSLFLTNAQTYGYVEGVTSTNFNIHVVAVGTTDTNISTQVRFSPFTESDFSPGDGGFRTPIVEFRSLATNVIDLTRYTNYLYLIDEMASGTNRTLLDNLTTPVGYRPAPLILTRFEPFTFTSADRPNTEVTPGLIYNSGYSNRIVTNYYAAYAAQVESSASRLPRLSDVTPRQLPGRLEIEANQLNMENTRLRGEGLLSIKSQNVTGTDSLRVDSGTLAYNLSSTGSRPLTIQNMARAEVERLSGPIVAHTAVWTNSVATGDTNAPSIELRFLMTIVDGNGLSSRGRVSTLNLDLTADGGNGTVELKDPFTVSESLRIKAASLVLHTNLTLRNGLLFSPSSLDGVRNLTNYGRLELGGTSELATRTGGRLASVNNSGQILAFNHIVKTEYFENSGGIISTQYTLSSLTNFCYSTVQPITNTAPSIGSINVDALIAKLDGGTLFTSGDAVLSGNVWKLNRSSVNLGGSLNINIQQVLTDNGLGSSNMVSVKDGFTLAASETIGGSLLGTHVLSSAAKFNFIDHVWGVPNRGSSVAAFGDSVPVGLLELNMEDGTARMNFKGTGANRALYVDVLRISGGVTEGLTLAKFLASVKVDPNLTIYFADVQSTNSSVLATVNAEALQEGSSGRFVWVKDFVGDYGSVDVALSTTGPSVRMNRSLRNSLREDSDGDGVANRLDDFPLTPSRYEGGLEVVESSFVKNTRTLSLKFYGFAGRTYRIETSPSVSGSNWTPVGQTITPSSAGLQTLSIVVNSGASQAYYRVAFNP